MRKSDTMINKEIYCWNRYGYKVKTAYLQHLGVKLRFVILKYKIFSYI